MEEVHIDSISLFFIALFLAIVNFIIIVKDFSSISKQLLHLLPNIVLHLCNTWTRNKGLMHRSSASSSSSSDSTTLCADTCRVRSESLNYESCRLSVEAVREIINHAVSQCEDDQLEVGGLFEEEEARSEEVREAFGVFDENQDGFIDAGELKRVLCSLGLTEYSERECSKMIRAFDENSDGRIEFSEFVKVLEESFS